MLVRNFLQRMKLNLILYVPRPNRFSKPVRSRYGLRILGKHADKHFSFLLITKI